MSKKHTSKKVLQNMMKQAAPAAPQQTTEQAVAAATIVPTAGAKADTVYRVIAPKRPLTGTKYGANGNDATHHALAEQATQNGGTITYAQALAVCKAQNHARFLGYAIRRLRVLVPVGAETQQSVASQQAAA